MCLLSISSSSLKRFRLIFISDEIAIDIESSLVGKEPGVVKAQLVANGAYIEFNLLKTKKTSVSKIIKEIKSFSILVLTPPPLDYKRQEYLYHNIRPFVRDEFKDITCPSPTYTGNQK